jgi:hypothetical protein
VLVVVLYIRSAHIASIYHHYDARWLG